MHARSLCSANAIVCRLDHSAPGKCRMGLYTWPIFASPDARKFHMFLADPRYLSNYLPNCFAYICPCFRRHLWRGTTGLFWQKPEQHRSVKLSEMSSQGITRLVLFKMFGEPSPWEALEIANLFWPPRARNMASDATEVQAQSQFWTARMFSLVRITWRLYTQEPARTGLREFVLGSTQVCVLTT